MLPRVVNHWRPGECTTPYDTYRYQTATRGAFAALVRRYDGG
jgi:hypothetical protein